LIKICEKASNFAKIKAIKGNSRRLKATQSHPPNPMALVPGNVFGYHAAMLIVHVHVHVKPESVEAFTAATITNARLSRLEPGVLRFDVLQQADDPTKFVLVEIYRDAAASAAHKDTPHYPVWRDTVAPMMAEPRSSVKFSNVVP
jgi:quinol monooxygenase YgiN